MIEDQTLSPWSDCTSRWFEARKSSIHLCLQLPTVILSHKSSTNESI